MGRRPAPATRLAGDLETDVVVVGGGLTGCLTASLFARAGVRVVLLEAERIGDRAALDAGWLLETPGVDFLALQAALGLKDARRAYEASRKAALDVAAFLRRLGPKLAPEPREALVIAATPDAAAALERERAARLAAGLDAVWLPARRAATESGADLVRGALKTRSEGVIDPWQTVRALVDVATAAGARLFELSPATKVRHTRTGVEVVTAKGTVRAKAVVLATGAPRPLVAALQRHVRVDHTYVVVTEELPAAMRRAVPADAVVRSLGGAARRIADQGRSRGHPGWRPAAGSGAARRAGPRPADRAADVRVVAAPPVRVGHPGGLRLDGDARHRPGRAAHCRRPSQLPAPSLRARAGRRPAWPAPGWRPGSSCGSTRASPNPPTPSSASGASG